MSEVIVALILLGLLQASSIGLMWVNHRYYEDRFRRQNEYINDMADLNMNHTNRMADITVNGLNRIDAKIAAMQGGDDAVQPR